MSRSGKKKGGGGGGGGGGLGRAILKERNRGKGSHGGGSWVNFLYGTVHVFLYF